MKVLLADFWIHEKNRHGLKLMCDSVGAEFVVSDQIQRLFEDWDLVIIPSQFIEPEYIVNAKHIIYGPHSFLFPIPPWQTYAFDTRCKYLSPSQWAKDFVIEGGNVNLPIITSPFAVDIEKFKPSISNKYYDCIVYYKHRCSDDIEYVENILKSKNITYKKFVYSKYKEEDYIKSLNECHYAIWVTSTESQGFALQECLSMNVPILVWNATSLFDEYTLQGDHVYKDKLGKYELKGTTIPYWDERCGIAFTKKEDFEPCFDIMRSSYTKFHPRDFVLENLSPKVCMERLINLLKVGDTNLNLHII